MKKITRVSLHAIFTIQEEQMNEKCSMDEGDEEGIQNLSWETSEEDTCWKTKVLEDARVILK
jgi:hypothetical protein